MASRYFVKRSVAVNCENEENRGIFFNEKLHRI
jgi:hypothetical protein